MAKSLKPTIASTNKSNENTRTRTRDSRILELGTRAASAEEKRKLCQSLKWNISRHEKG
jgi:hypothetical protein